ncbi:MAG: hypothetical protein L6R41_005766 [Letrouitia leprolyta]|nr:MAG: hypothetical protein L6R41_005766 [Letrouitia leprolyta]
MDYRHPTTVIYQQQPPQSVIVAQPSSYITSPQVVQPNQYLQLPPPSPVGTMTTATTTHQDLQPQYGSAKHTCAACGKFRSARYHYRHQLAPGETPRPTLCRKCVRQHTSSEEFDEIERARRRRRERQAQQQQHRHRRSYSSNEWSSSSSHEERRRRHRYRSLNEARRHRGLPRSSSAASTKIYIIRQPEERRRPQSSSESVRILHRVRTSEDRLRPSPQPHSRHYYGPFDGHLSYEEFYSDEHIEADNFERRGRSHSRGSRSIEEDYVRVSASIPRRRLSLLDRLGRSRSRSSSRSRWHRSQVQLDLSHASMSTKSEQSIHQGSLGAMHLSLCLYIEMQQPLRRAAMITMTAIDTEDALVVLSMRQGLFVLKELDHQVYYDDVALTMACATIAG